MILIVGLGNPGKQYENTYHNIGFLALDSFLNKHNLKLTKKKGNALIFEGKLLGQKVILAKPQTYMNLSGTSVASLASSFKVDPKQTLIIYDDIDLEEGAVRYRTSGSGGTHNGMKDIVRAVGEEVARVRIGIGRDERKDLADYVLSRIKKIDAFEQSFEKTIELMEEFIEKEGKIENKSVL